MGTVMPDCYVRQSEKLFVHDVHLTLAEAAPVFMEHGAHFPENSHNSYTDLPFASSSTSAIISALEMPVRM